MRFLENTEFWVYNFTQVDGTQENGYTFWDKKILRIFICMDFKQLDESSIFIVYNGSNHTYGVHATRIYVSDILTLSVTRNYVSNF